MTFEEFSDMNRNRCEAANGFNHKLGSWSRSDWLAAVMGELGEAANIAKKLNRVRDGIPGNTDSESVLLGKFIEELADTFIYLDLLFQAEGTQLIEAVMAKLEDAIRVWNRRAEHAYQRGYEAAREDALNCAIAVNVLWWNIEAVPTDSAGNPIKLGDAFATNMWTCDRIKDAIKAMQPERKDGA